MLNWLIYKTRVYNRILLVYINLFCIVVTPPNVLSVGEFIRSIFALI